MSTLPNLPSSFPYIPPTAFENLIKTAKRSIQQECQFILERANLEMEYAKSLSDWSSKLRRVIDTDRLFEYGCMKRNMLQLVDEADSCAKAHQNYHEALKADNGPYYSLFWYNETELKENTLLDEIIRRDVIKDQSQIIAEMNHYRRTLEEHQHLVNKIDKYTKRGDQKKAELDKCTELAETSRYHASADFTHRSRSKHLKAAQEGAETALSINITKLHGLLIRERKARSTFEKTSRECQEFILNHERHRIEFLLQQLNKFIDLTESLYHGSKQQVEILSRTRQGLSAISSAEISKQWKEIHERVLNYPQNKLDAEEKAQLSENASTNSTEETSATTQCKVGDSLTQDTVQTHENDDLSVYHKNSYTQDTDKPNLPVASVEPNPFNSCSNKDRSVRSRNQDGFSTSETTHARVIHVKNTSTNQNDSTQPNIASNLSDCHGTNGPNGEASVRNNTATPDQATRRQRTPSVDYYPHPRSDVTDCRDAYTDHVEDIDTGIEILEIKSCESTEDALTAHDTVHDESINQPSTHNIRQSTPNRPDPRQRLAAQGSWFTGINSDCENLVSDERTPLDILQQRFTGPNTLASSTRQVFCSIKADKKSIESTNAKCDEQTQKRKQAAINTDTLGDQTGSVKSSEAEPTSRASSARDPDKVKSIASMFLARGAAQQADPVALSPGLSDTDSQDGVTDSSTESLINRYGEAKHDYVAPSGSRELSLLTGQKVKIKSVIGGCEKLYGWTRSPANLMRKKYGYVRQSRLYFR